MPVMQILNALEEGAFESPPHFTSLERKKFFARPSSLQELSDGFRTPTNKVCFLIAFGYFKARRKLFSKQFRPPDIQFVATRYGLSLDDVEPSAYDKQTALRHQQTILDLFGYGRFDDSCQELAARARGGKGRRAPPTEDHLPRTCRSAHAPPCSPAEVLSDSLVDRPRDQLA